MGKVGIAVEGRAVTSPPRLDAPRCEDGAFRRLDRPPVMGLSELLGEVNAAIVGSAREARGAPSAALGVGLGVSQAGAAPRAETTKDHHHEAHVNPTLVTRGRKTARAAHEYA